MSAVIQLSNKEGDVVELPEEVAKTLFGRLKDVDSLLAEAQQGDVDDVEETEQAPQLFSHGAQDETLSLHTLDCPKVALEVIKSFATLSELQRTAIPKPLDRPLASIVTEEEMALVKAAEAHKYLTPLLETAVYLKFDALTNLCAAYTYERIEEIAKDAPDIMAGAERIRQFLGMQNEWTAEEMAHLRKEMEFAKGLDPNAY